MDFVDNERPSAAVITRVGSQESLTQAVLDAVRAAPDRTDDAGTVAPGDRSGPPLYDAVDVDALESLYAHARRHGESVEWTTAFTYAGHDVVVNDAGDVSVAPSDHSARTPGRDHRCPDCDDDSVSVDGSDAVVDATFQCPSCGHRWTVELDGDD